MLGDGESAEGSVWEAAEAAAHDRLDSLCGITDVNGLGQSGPSIWNHDMDAYASKWRAFGWHSLVVDGTMLARSSMRSTRRARPRVSRR
jgi:transketolase